jgi:hypothetical protein
MGNAPATVGGHSGFKLRYSYHAEDQLNNPRLEAEGFKGCRLEIDYHL